MSYRNKTYVIFDGDNDIWAYGFMLGWRKNDNTDFNFYDAHEVKPLVNASSEVHIKRVLRERMSNAKQVIVLIGESTKHLYKFVRWELEIALEMDLPVIAANLNDLRTLDDDRVPPIIRNEFVLHVPFKMTIIKYALDYFPTDYHKRDKNDRTPRHFNPEVYTKFGL